MRATKRTFEFGVYFYFLVFASLFVFILTLNDIAMANFKTGLNGFSFILSIFVLIFFVVLMITPILLVIKMKGYKSKEEEPETKPDELENFKERTFLEKIWRNYTNGLRRNIFARLFYTFLLFKQLCYAIIFVFVTGKEAQLSLFIIATFFYLMYIIIVRPFEHLVQNIISLINEFIVLLCAFLMIAFLDDGEQKTGFATAIIVLFSITIIGSFVISIIFQIYQMCLRRKRSKVEKQAEVNESNIHIKNNDIKGVEESPYESRDEPIMNDSGLPPIHKKRGEETSRFEELKDESFKGRQDSLGLGDSDRKSKIVFMLIVIVN